MVVGSTKERMRERAASNPYKGTRAAGCHLPSTRRLLLAILMAAIVFATVTTISTHKNQLAMMEPNDAEAMGLTLDARSKRLRLRYDWTNLSPSLELTKYILKHQSNCSIPMSSFTYRNRFGLGSDLHVYGQALGYGIQTNKRIRTVGNWTWMDQHECRIAHNNDSSSPSRVMLGSPMKCYFAASELNCPGDVGYAVNNPGFDASGSLSKPNGHLIIPSKDENSGPEILPPRSNTGIQMLQTAVVESLFTRVTPRVVEEAERQLNLVFGGRVPADLITVHIRWGDKVASFERKNKRIQNPEMEKVEISNYIDAIHKILDRRERTKNSSSKSTSKQIANIYLATEDPEAVTEFRKALPKGWNLYVDQFLIDTSEHRNGEYNGNPKMAKALNGNAGLLALGSLLVAMEANDFVLTTKSNWSQLMDELRRTILDPRCGNCTSLIDLRQNER